MGCAASLAVNVSSVSGRSKNMGSSRRHIDPAHLPCFGRLLIDLACLLCCISAPAMIAPVEADFLQTNLL
jgi:hypothetical protein